MKKKKIIVITLLIILIPTIITIIYYQNNKIISNKLLDNKINLNNYCTKKIFDISSLYKNNDFLNNYLLSISLSDNLDNMCLVSRSESLGCFDLNTNNYIKEADDFYSDYFKYDKVSNCYIDKKTKKEIFCYNLEGTGLNNQIFFNQYSPNKYLKWERNKYGNINIYYNGKICKTNYENVNTYDFDSEGNYYFIGENNNNLYINKNCEEKYSNENNIKFYTISEKGDIGYVVIQNNKQIVYLNGKIINKTLNFVKQLFFKGNNLYYTGNENNLIVGYKNNKKIFSFNDMEILYFDVIGNNKYIGFIYEKVNYKNSYLFTNQGVKKVDGELNITFGRYLNEPLNPVYKFKIGEYVYFFILKDKKIEFNKCSF